METEGACRFREVGCDVEEPGHDAKRPIKHLTLLNGATTDLKRTVEQLETTDTSSLNKFEQLKTSANGVICGSSPAFIWKISNFSDQQRAAKIRISPWIVSPPFESGPNGYRLHAMIAPNGFGEGANKDLAVFVQLTDSPMNPILEWPFARKIRITIYDQRTEFCRRRNLQAVIEPEKVPDNEEYLRCPRKDEQNAPFGLASFCALKVLKDTYVGTDELYIGFDFE
uniref:MATH domain-containing protein n=1 Tax=Panagrellus redivivus TaxID=6233 RepID=A0A7E4UUM4_PANRE